MAPSIAALCAVLLCTVVGAIAYLGHAAIMGSRSPAVFAVALLIGLVGAAGASYAWTESHSLSWTIGYGGTAFLAVSAAVVGWIRGGQRNVGAGASPQL